MVPSEKKELKSHPVLLSPPSRLLVLWRNAARAPSARVSASAPPYLCVWSRLSHCLVYFHHRMAVLDRVRPKLGFGYGFGAETAKFLGFGLVSVTAVTRILVSAWFRLRRNSKFSFGIVTASRNSDIEFGKHGIILQLFPNAVSACPYAKLASSG